MDSGLRHHADAVALLEGQPASPAVARVLSGYGSMLLLRGHYRRAVEVSTEAIEVAKAVGAEQAELYALNTLGVGLAQLGDCDGRCRDHRATHSPERSVRRPPRFGSRVRQLRDGPPDLRPRRGVGRPVGRGLRVGAPERGLADVRRLPRGQPGVDAHRPRPLDRGSRPAGADGRRRAAGRGDPQPRDQCRPTRRPDGRPRSSRGRSSSNRAERSDSFRDAQFTGAVVRRAGRAGAPRGQTRRCMGPGDGRDGTPCRDRRSSLRTSRPGGRRAGRRRPGARRRGGPSGRRSRDGRRGRPEDRRRGGLSGDRAGPPAASAAEPLAFVALAEAEADRAAGAGGRDRWRAAADQWARLPAAVVHGVCEVSRGGGLLEAGGPPRRGRDAHRRCPEDRREPRRGTAPRCHRRAGASGPADASRGGRRRWRGGPGAGTGAGARRG